MPAASEETKYRTATFGSDGNDAPDDGVPGDVPVIDNPEDIESDDGEAPDDGAAAAQGAGAQQGQGGKYRIGDKEFNTAEEAYAFATSQVSTLQTEIQVRDAYQQGMQDAAQVQNPQQGVTPATEAGAPAFDSQKYYENPEEFLQQYAKQVEDRVLNKIQSQTVAQTQAQRVWTEFSSRHPDLADFAPDVDSVAAENMAQLKIVNATKGPAAGYDFIAMKVREKFQRHAQALKPGRQLSNTRQAQPQGGTVGVTPPKQPKKPKTFSEQIRSMRPGASSGQRK